MNANYWKTYLKTRRGLTLTLFLTGLLVLLHFIFIGMVFIATMMMDESPDIELTYSNIDTLRQRAEGLGFLGYIWVICIIYEVAYLQKNQLFQRFIVQGKTRFEWGVFLITNIVAASLFLALFNSAVVNLMAIGMYDIYNLTSFYHLLTTWTSLLYLGLFGILLALTIPSSTTAFLALGWFVLELILLNNNTLNQALFDIPAYFPYNAIAKWCYAAEPSFSQNLTVCIYFVAFVSLIFFTLNKKAYVSK